MGWALSLGIGIGTATDFPQVTISDRDAGMSISALTNGRVLVGDSQEAATVLIEGDRILDVVSESAIPTKAVRHDLAGRHLVPGFIDVQVNGGGGLLFNNCPTVDGIRAIGAAHRRYGTTGFLPTLISDKLAVIERGMAAVDDAIDSGVPGVLGIHVEGPFLNPAKRGIHDAINIRDIDEAALKVLTRPVRGRIMVTLAPEKVGNASIRRLNEAGVIVSAGHTDASYDEMKEGFENGVTSMTHLFNAMSPMNARAPGAVGAALENRSVHCGIIVDGFHVHPAALRLALSIGPLSRFLLVTDAMPAVGTSLNRFTLGDVEIQVSGGRCIDAAGTLAGAHLTMAEAVSNAQNLLGTSFAQAVSLASTNPARLLGLHMRGRIAAGFIADLAALDGATVTDTWISGKHHEA